MSDVTITITRATAALTQAGFGLPLIVGTSKDLDYRECTSLTEVSEDSGFESTSEAYKMAQAVFGQSPRPPKIAVVGFDGGAATDLPASLDTLVETRNDWYFLLCEEQGATGEADPVVVGSEIHTLSKWAAANQKLYFACPDGNVAETITLAGAVVSDRTALIYHNTPTSYPDAAWVGRCAPTQPGSITWKFKTLNGIDASTATTTNISDLHADNVNTYVQKYGVNQTSEGKTTGDEYIDVMRGIDFIEARLAEGISRLLFTSPKVPYDVRGISLVLAEVEAVMQLGVAYDIIAQDEDGNGIYDVSAPAIADIPANEKANRNLPDVNFSFTLAGAVHTVQVFGVVTV